MIRIREESPGVLYSDESLVRIGREEVDFLASRVESTPLKRIRLCAHRGIQDRLQEMFIVHSRHTYIRPHRHVSKSESLLVLQGEADAVFFEDRGRIANVMRLGEYGSGHTFFYRIDDAVYHSLVIHSEILAFMEATTGPFSRVDSEFAPWSPDPANLEGGRRYMAELAGAVNAYYREQGGRKAG